MTAYVEVMGAIGREGDNGGTLEEGREGGELGERGLEEVKKSWKLWCWRRWQGSAVRHLDTGERG